MHDVLVVGVFVFTDAWHVGYRCVCMSTASCTLSTTGSRPLTTGRCTRPVTSTSPASSLGHASQVCLIYTCMHSHTHSSLALSLVHGLLWGLHTSVAWSGKLNKCIRMHAHTHTHTHTYAHLTHCWRTKHIHCSGSWELAILPSCLPVTLATPTLY